MNKRISMLLLALLMLVMGCAACGSSDANGDDTSWEYIQNNGKLIVGLDDTFAPMGFRDAAGNLVGFDIDLANAVGEVLGIAIEFQPIDWTGKEMELSSKRVDCLWNGMSATPARQESMALTDKYLNNMLKIASFDASINIKSAADLANYTIGIQGDSAALEVVMEHPDYALFAANITEYPTYDEAMLDMQAGRVQVIVIDQVLCDYKNSNLDNKVVYSDFDFGDDFYAIGCRKGEVALAAKLTEALKTLIENGKAAEISQKWFGQDVVILEGYDK